MNINIDSCKQAINQVKSNINNCFALCDTKGSTYQEINKTLTELYQKIDGIPNNATTITGKGQPFSGFNCSSTGSDLTIACGSVGVGWRGITIYSNEKRGYFSIYKIDNERAIVAGLPWYYYDDGDTIGAFPYNLTSTSSICNYTISDNSITLVPIIYSVEEAQDISMLGNQIDVESNYMLDLIDIF